MPESTTRLPRPELELSDKQAGAIRYLEHGCPHWRIRWHYHEEYELHYIVASSGKVFVGNYIGNFEPGCFMLIGPRLPHNWISHDNQRHALRDQVVHFDHDVMLGAMTLLPELRSVLPLLERARKGVAFPGQERLAARYMARIRTAMGTRRLAVFFELMDILARSDTQRVLSTAHIELPINDEGQEKIDRVLNYVSEHYQQKIPLAEVAALANMSESYFSRYFRKATGNRFSDFINQIRVNKACELLRETDRLITRICYDVGFNNVANFNRRFVQHQHMTPSDYRLHARQSYHGEYECRDDTLGDRV